MHPAFSSCRLCFRFCSTFPLRFLHTTLPRGCWFALSRRNSCQAGTWGTIGLTKDACVMIWTSTPELIHGRIGFCLTYLQKLERQGGEKWVEVPITPTAHNEPRKCQEPAG